MKVFSGTNKAGNRNDIAKLVELFGNKTLDEVGFIHGLDSGNVKFAYGFNPKTNEEIPSIKLVVKGQDYFVPLSRGFGGVDGIAKAKSNPDWFLKCEFRAGLMSVKTADGTPKVDENGDIVLNEEKPYISFGKPSGLTVDREEDAFAPMTEEQIAKLKAALPTLEPAQ